MSYPGGKNGAGVYQAIINLMPPHETYIEPFLGGGAIMRLKRPAARNIGLDLDTDVVRQWQAFTAGIGAQVLTARSGASPENASAAATAVSSEQRRRRSPNPAMLASSPRFEIRLGNGIEFLQSYTWTGDELVYCDPPYLLSTRGHRRYYRYELEEDGHVELLRALNALNCRVMISGYSSPLYAKHLKSWNATAFQAATRGRPAAEWIWYNFDRPVELHDYRFLGKDYRERERIKRKIRRWMGKLERMPLIERQALLAAISSRPADFSEGARSRIAG